MKNNIRLLSRLITLSSLLTLTPVYGNPTGGDVVGGSASIVNNTQKGIPTTTITQTSDRAIIEWKSFDIAQQEHVHFQQPNANSIVVNKVVGGWLSSPSHSTIAGQLTSTGQVWLLNQAGFLFTDTSKVDVAGILVTTNATSKGDFLEGRYHIEPSVSGLTRADEHSSIIIEKDAEINVGLYGSLILIAPNIKNEGKVGMNTIVADGRLQLIEERNYDNNRYNMVYILIAGKEGMETLSTGVVAANITTKDGHAQVEPIQSTDLGGYLHYPAVISQPVNKIPFTESVLDQAINTKDIAQATLAVIQKDGEIVLK